MNKIVTCPECGILYNARSVTICPTCPNPERDKRPRMSKFDRNRHGEMLELKRSMRSYMRRHIKGSKSTSN